MAQPSERELQLLDLLYGVVQQLDLIAEDVDELACETIEEDIRRIVREIEQDLNYDVWYHREILGDSEYGRDAARDSRQAVHAAVPAVETAGAE